MGSAVLAHCARRGMRVIGFEQFGPGHDLGSSSGRSRMIRKAYYEAPAYVPMLLRAYEAWRELERETRMHLLRITGLLMIGGERSEVLTGALQSAAVFDLCVEQLDAKRIRERFPMFAVRDEECAVYEPEGGYVLPEPATAALQRSAIESGAEIWFGRAVPLERAFEYARQVVVSAGPWLDSLRLGLPLKIERNTQHWFRPSSRRFAEGSCPAYLVERPEFEYPLYGFPDHGYGVKAAFHGSGEYTQAPALDREIHEADITPVRGAVEALLPGSTYDYLDGKACMYELTPDRNFILSRHPSEPRVIVAGGFSGHGFKFVPVVGEIVAALASDEAPRFDIGFLSAARFTAQASIPPASPVLDPRGSL